MGMRHRKEERFTYKRAVELLFEQKECGGINKYSYGKGLVLSFNQNLPSKTKSTSSMRMRVMRPVEGPARGRMCSSRMTSSSSSSSSSLAFFLGLPLPSFLRLPDFLFFRVERRLEEKEEKHTVSRAFLSLNFLTQTEMRQKD